MITKGCLLCPSQPVLINLSWVYKLEVLSYMFDNKCSGGQAEIAGHRLPLLQGHGFQGS